MTISVAAMFVSLSRTLLVYVPMGWVLSQFFGLIGIFIAGLLANFVAGGVAFVWFRTALHGWIPRQTSEARS